MEDKLAAMHEFVEAMEESTGGFQPSDNLIVWAIIIVIGIVAFIVVKALLKDWVHRRKF